MSLQSPQAVLPRVNPYLKGQVISGEAPVTTAGAGAVTVFANEQPLQEMILQVCSAQAVKVAFNADASAVLFNVILPAATGVDDGTSAPYTINMRMGIYKVSLYGAGAIRVAVTKVINNSATGRM